MKRADLSAADLSEIIEMALSDHVSFDHITQQHGVSADEIKAIMRSNLKPGSYRVWRKRVDVLPNLLPFRGRVLLLNA